ncbi:lysozyme inhibitor LprI family protein [Paraburkholderia sediminicola]|uniref:lysozyme inhibitor LprI family protein n=1 Tax=Paraburkholderia sediminicola TaxID=458836 RepID=UPI0038BBD368
MNKQRNHSIGHHLRLALLVAITAGSVPASAASFDCKRARLPDEKAICASRQLSELDVEMSVRYQMLMGLVAMGTRGDMGDEQQSWLSARKKCGAHQTCLLTAYRQRIQTLKDEYTHLASRGPF